MRALHGGPHGHGQQHGAVWIDGDGVEDVDVHVMHDMTIETMHDMDGIVIHSGQPIDAATQQAIKSLLESAGHDSDVRFIDREGYSGGPHRIRMIEKKLEATN